jgi:hypothetical protein
VRLFEHPDFQQAILQATEHFRDRGLRPAIIEKDTYVTEALRIIAATGDRVIFKGGTSLAKGWNLIQRFSEDIDIFLDPAAFKPALGSRAIDRELKSLRDAVGAQGALTFIANESQTTADSGAMTASLMSNGSAALAKSPTASLVEAGTASGREPTVVVELHSYLSQFLRERAISLGAEDERPFAMRLLHFRRTFVEKRFAIHSKVELLKRDGRPLGSYARHYYDLFQLSAQDEVIAMINSTEYAAIKTDFDQISRTHFQKSYFHPGGMSFAR